MAFAGIGAIMLMLVLFVYLRSIDKGPSRKDRSRQNDRWLLEQVDALEDFGRRKDAMALLEKALQTDPDNRLLKSRLDLIKESQ
jgi:hypothetical protein